MSVLQPTRKSRRRRVTILTVGDGDLSCSLALLRAYGSRTGTSPSNTAKNNNNNENTILHRLVATTLISCEEDLLKIYDSKHILDELLLESSSSSSSSTKQQQEENTGTDCCVTILYGVDATRLHTHPSLSLMKFDFILFHHPHLGYSTPTINNHNNDEDDNDQHAMKHSCLLAHYFDSAQRLLQENGCIHVCLCSGAVHRWKLDDVVHHLKLKYVHNSPRPASRPLLDFGGCWDCPTTTTTTAPIQTASAAEMSSSETVIQMNHRPKHHKKGGSRKGHWLGKYGYRHQPTFPQANNFKTNVSNSYHYFLQPKEPTRLVSGGSGDDGTLKGKKPNDDDADGDDDDVDDWICPICNQTFSDAEALQAHTLAPALPTL